MNSPGYFTTRIKHYMTLLLHHFKTSTVLIFVLTFAHPTVFGQINSEHKIDYQFLSNKRVEPNPPISLS
ncbi:hypothetical protein EV197_3142 [Aquimarina brevivitae]|uniref:Uncharacterized protein n=1 Tax=Aquimarina brevivitae TaxID=323412 RepID=A0A4Q7NU91_9FLAO|nr:hypothetical protein EV197_3142 [Aquimarina brevivitae]